MGQARWLRILLGKIRGKFRLNLLGGTMVFTDAMARLLEGKSLRRECWSGESYHYKIVNNQVCWYNGKRYRQRTIDIIDQNAVDWEIYEDAKLDLEVGSKVMMVKTGCVYLITGVIEGGRKFVINGGTVSVKYLLEHYIYADGTPIDLVA